MSLLGIIASSKKFQPTDISNLYLWLNAGDTGSFTYSSGTVVSQWNDLSGNGYHAAQTTVANQPSRSTTSGPQVDFDGSNDMLLTTATFNGNAFSYFMVAKFGTGIIQGVHLGGEDGSNDIYFPYSSTLAYWQTNNNWGTYSINDTSTNQQCAEMIYNGSGSTNADKIKVRFKGVDQTLTFTGTILSTLSRTASTGIGAYNNAGSPLLPSGTSIKEIVIYNRVLNATEISQVRTYLNTQWGVTT